MAGDPVVFLDDLLQSRALIERLVAKRGGTMSTTPILPPGPDGAPLSIASARIGPIDAPRVLFLISGVHGVEGPAGGAIQASFLRDTLNASPLADDEAVVIIHAANPFGWAWSRRATSENVDLNRNFADFSDLPTTPDYEALNEAINPERLDDQTFNVAIGRLLAARAQNGAKWLQRVITEGQYTRPEGVHFGGYRPTEEHQILRTIVRTHAAHARACVFVDLHTGLGDYGDWIVISGAEVGTENAALVERHVAPFRYRSPYGGEQIEAPATRGKLGHALEMEASPARAISMTVEFGTYADDRVFLAEMRENWLYNHGADAAPDVAEAIMQEMRACYAPSDPAWRLKVVQGGQAAIADMRALLRAC